jgi:lysozyme
VSAVDVALPRLKTEEGFRAQKYLDSEGHVSIGFGFDVDAGISEYAASALLYAQTAELHHALLEFPWYAALNEVRQSVCLDIAFNDGLHGLLGFPSLIHYLSIEDWPNAAAQCHVKNPELAGRYAVLAKLLLDG